MVTPVAHRLRVALPWLGAALLLAWAFRSVSITALGAALHSGPWLRLAGFAVLEVAALLAVDAWATRVALAQTGICLGYPEVAEIRGATYLLGLVNYAVGQGGIGVYLARRGADSARSAGIVFFLLVTNGLALLVGLGLGLVLDAAPELDPYRPLALLIAAGVLAYLVVVASWPRSLRRWSLLDPLQQAGIGGHLRSFAARLAHLGVLLVGNWVALRLWGIEAPFSTAFSRLPVVVFGSALPVTPNGVGAVQALQVPLFAAWAPGAEAATRAASVLAFSLAHQGLGLLCQGIVGMACLARLRRGRQ